MLFLQWHIFYDVTITFFCVTFALRMKITWPLRLIFVRHCEVFFITSQLRYFFVRCTHVFYGVRIRLYFGTFKLRMKITLQLRFVFVRHCNVFLLRHNYVTFFDDVRIMLYFGKFEVYTEITLQNGCFFGYVCL